jgi:uncharacterized membrane protein YbhN (UPF0104 family)
LAPGKCTQERRKYRRYPHVTALPQRLRRNRPNPRPTIALGGLLVAFKLAAAAGTSVPIPAGLGTTEAALIAVLVTAHVQAGHAVQVVLIFRLVTFWLPVLALLALRHLHRHHAI